MCVFTDKHTLQKCWLNFSPIGHVCQLLNYSVKNKSIGTTLPSAGLCFTQHGNFFFTSLGSSLHNNLAKGIRKTWVFIYSTVLWRVLLNKLCPYNKSTQ